MMRAVILAGVAGLATSASAQSTWTGDGDGFNWTDALNWDGGVDPNGAGVDVVIDGDNGNNAEVWLDTFRSIGTLTITVDDSLRLLQGGNLTLNGGALNNDGTLFLDASGATAADVTLSFSTASLISGTGEIVMSDDFDNTILSTGSILTNGAGHTIRGAGGLLFNSGGVINNGSIIADAMNNQLRLDPGGEGFVNNGVLRATGAAGLLLASGAYTNNSTIEAANGSRVDVGNLADIIGGTLLTTGSGVINALSGSDFTGVTIASGSSVVQAQGQNVEIRSGLTNNGTWSIESFGGTSAATILDFVGIQTVGGTGSLVLSDDFDNLVRATGAIITQDAGHTIRGAGALLANSGGIINNGSIIADAMNNQLRIDPGGEGFANNGVLRATGAAGLLLASGAYTNNSTIEAANGSRVDVGNLADIIGGTLLTTGSGVINALSGSDFTGVTVAAGSSVVQAQGQNVEIRSGLTNNGVWSVLSTDATATDTLLDFIGTQTLDGTGSLVLSDDFDNLVRATGAVITHGADHTIRGSGGLLANSGGIINNGSIIADGALDQLRIDPGTEGFVNNGVLRATGAAGLLLGSGVYVNNTAIEAADGSLVEIGNIADVQGGDLTTAGSGVIQARSGAALTGVTITSGSDVRQEQGQNVSIRSGMTNNGTYSVLATGATATDVVLDFVGSQTLDGTGSLVLSDDFDNLVRATGAVITHGADHTIRGGGGLLANSGGIINNGTILADAPGNALRIDPGTEGFVNNGELRAENGGTLLLSSGVYINNATITARDASVVQVDNIAEIRGGQLRTTGSGVFELLSGADLTNVRITSGSLVRQGQSQNVDIRGNLVNNGDYRLESNGSTSVDTLIDFVGTQSVVGSGTLWMSDDFDNVIRATGSVVTNGPGHTIRGAGTLLQNSGGIVNLGFILAEGVNALNINPGSEGFQNVAGGTLGGTGTMNFVDGSLANDGILAAGIDGTGTFTLGANVTNSATAELAVQIAGSADSDLINVIGSYEAGGEISARLLAGFVPAGSETFVVLTATNGVTGNFANAIADGSGVATGVVSGAFTFDVIYEANQISITNVIPAPGAGAFLLFGGLLAARRRRG